MSLSVDRHKFRLKKGDTVVVISGKDKGKKGKILQIDSEARKVLVEKVNLVKRHLKPTRESKGGIVDQENRLHLSKVMLLCPLCDKPARIGIRQLDEGQRLRFCRKCSEVIDKG